VSKFEAWKGRHLYRWPRAILVIATPLGGVHTRECGGETWFWKYRSVLFTFL